YERCAISPLIVRDGAGESFPSRHAFSAFAIAASWFAAAVPVALALLAVAALLAVCRVLGGVHFPRDVIAGALVGVAVGGLAAFLATLL
ncbi:MAG: phosphatase PAP2 family protein, partial [Adlercreutzia equolifaciens]